MQGRPVSEGNVSSLVDRVLRNRGILYSDISYKFKIKVNKYTLDKIEFKKWGVNLLKFTAPILAILFAQLAMGVEWKQAGLLALYALYALLADYFKKLK